jgi:hypothetical protein
MRLEDHELERELRAERSEPDHDFARRLDEWAQAGFPRDRGLGPHAARQAGTVETLTERLRAGSERLRAVPPRRLLMPAAAAVTLIVVVAVAVGQLDPGSSSETADTSGQINQSAGDSTGAEPSISSGSAGAGAVGADASAESSAPALSGKERSATDQGLDSVVPVPPPSDGGGIARGTDKRLVDATAQLTLGADRGEVQDVANDVVGVTDRHKGVVLDSQISDDKKNARADFQLEIPYNQLDAALTDLSELGDVLSRTQAGHDITAAAVRTRRDLAGVYDRIRKARADLIRADTTEQKQLIEARIQSLNASADTLQTKLAGVQRQARFATVSVTVTSDRPNGSGAGSGDDGNWTVGEALDDAADILQTIAGVALITLAALAPIALIATLCWLTVTRARAHRREQALDG